MSEIQHSNSMIKPSATTQFEYDVVCEQIRKLQPRKVYVEVGSNKGNSLKAFSSVMESGSTLIAIDLPNSLWGTQHSEIFLKETQKELTEKGYDVQLVIGDSKIPDTHTTLLKLLNNRHIDVLFIDGDHTFYGVACDIHNYTKHVRNGGMVIFHDCGKIKAAGGGESAYKTIHGVNCVFEAFSYGKKWMIIQEQWGMGIVWM